MSDENMTEEEKEFVDYSHKKLQVEYSNIEKDNADSEKIRKEIAQSVNAQRTKLSEIRQSLEEQKMHSGQTSNIGVKECLEALESVEKKLSEVEGILRKWKKGK